MKYLTSTILLAVPVIGLQAQIRQVNLTAAANSCSSITIAWIDNSSDEEGFQG